MPDVRPFRHSEGHPVLLPLLILILALGIGFSVPQGARAQLVPSATSTDQDVPKGLDTLLQEAREAGSTVIVVKPAGEMEEDADPSNMRAKRFLESRARIEQIIGSGETLAEGVAGTLRNASPDGTSWWFWRGVITAFAGLFIAGLIIIPIIRWAREHFRYLYIPQPQTTADKARYLLFRAFLAVIYAAIFFLIAALVAVITDSGWEPTRRVIFEIIAGYCMYRLLRYGVAWNLFAHDLAEHRVVNLDDREANRIHHGFHWSVAICLLVTMPIRFLAITAAEQNAAGIEGGMSAEHILLVKMFAAAFVILVIGIFTAFTWREWQKAFAPRSAGKPFYRVLKVLASLLPTVWLLYSVFSFGAFVHLLALGAPAPAGVIAAPYVAMWVSFVLYGLVLIGIQFFYNRRQRMFDERVEAERERQAAERALLDEEAGEEMVSGRQPVEFEYQPVFRSFFERGALAIIVTVTLGELGRVWGIEVGRDGNAWAALLDIVLASILCWLAYRAVCVFIDRRMAEEGGLPESQDEEIGGEGGGAGVSRMATLLPILRYILITLIVSIAVMVILSRLGVDIGPIFAGAGVVGIAVGFGAQKLIQDIFSGAFFLLDDAFRRGEYIEIEGIKGTVEKISIRSFQLRHHLGALHTIPFGEIKQLTNYSRDWVLMKLPLRVTYDTDVEKVRKLVKKLGQELLEHPQVGHTFMQPLKSQGVYRMEDSAMIIRVKFMTKPGEQFVTRKVVYEAIQDLFAREGIHFAHKEVTVRLADGGQADRLSEQEKQAVASAARSVIDEEEAAEAALAGAVPDDR